jgi:hypothetical protein
VPSLASAHNRTGNTHRALDGEREENGIKWKQVARAAQMAGLGMIPEVVRAWTQQGFKSSLSSIIPPQQGKCLYPRGLVRCKGVCVHAKA